MKKIQINEDLMHRFFEHDLSPEETEALASWAKSNPKNQLRFNKELRVYAAALMMAAEAVALEEDEQAAAALREIEEGKRKHRIRRVIRMVSGIAAAVALTAGLSWLLMRESPADEWMTARTAYGERVTLELPDGSSVDLNAGTTLRYPTRFASAERRVSVSGEALFHVKEDKAHPFVVETFAYDVRVLGTTFNLMADESEASFTTTLLEGSVAIVDKASGLVAQQMAPKDVVRLGPDGQLQKTQMENPASATSWKDGVLSVGGMPFEQVIKAFERAFGARIVLQCEKMPVNRSPRMKVYVSDGVTVALDVLRASSDFTYSYDAQENIYYIHSK